MKKQVGLRVEGHLKDGLSEQAKRTNTGYGKDSFLEQPFELLEHQLPVIVNIYTNIRLKSSCQQTFSANSTKYF